MSVRKRIREMSQIAERYGFRYGGISNGDHLRWIDDRGNTVFTGKTPSDHRARKNSEAQMRKLWRQSQEKAA